VPPGGKSVELDPNPNYYYYYYMPVQTAMQLGAPENGSCYGTVLQ
jgi:hypothetical protein